jgi:predicted transcriptional regulator
MLENTNNKLPKLTPSEFEIMDVVWKNGSATVGMILDAINAARSDELRRSTIRVQVVRLEKKGWLKSERKGALCYLPVRSRIEATQEIIEDIKVRAFKGSCFEMIKALLSHSRVSGDEIQRVRKFINEQTEIE